MAADLPPGDAYRLLESRHRELKRLNVRPTGVTTSDGDVLYALDADGRRHVLVQIDSGELAVEDRRSAGVQVHRTVLTDEGRDLAYADVVCLLPHLNSVFEVFVSELLEVVERSNAPGSLILQVLDRWRELLEPSRSGLLGRERLAGLTGELLTLRSLTERLPVQATWWTGPTGHVHDIVWEGHSIEVKTTLSRDRDTVEINGLDQLAGAPDRRLHLVFVRLLQDAAAEMTVPGLVEDLAVRGLDRHELLHRAAQVGLAPTDLDAYSKVPFRLVEMLVFAVGNGFPRLTADSLAAGELPAGVSAVSYVLDLSGVKARGARVYDLTDLPGIIEAK